MDFMNGEKMTNNLFILRSLIENYSLLLASGKNGIMPMEPRCVPVQLLQQNQMKQ